jgi:hypothetical protein
VKNHKEEDDIYECGNALRNSLKRLNESEILSDGDKELIREFLEHLRAVGRHWEAGEVQIHDQVSDGKPGRSPPGTLGGRTSRSSPSGSRSKDILRIRSRIINCNQVLLEILSKREQ